MYIKIFYFLPFVYGKCVSIKIRRCDTFTIDNVTTSHQRQNDIYTNTGYQRPSTMSKLKQHSVIWSLFFSNTTFLNKVGMFCTFLVWCQNGTYEMFLKKWLSKIDNSCDCKIFKEKRCKILPILLHWTVGWFIWNHVMG